MNSHKPNPKLTQFLAKLTEGRYDSYARARSALGGTTGLDDQDKEWARSSIAAFFEAKRKKEEMAKEVEKESEPKQGPKQEPAIDLVAAVRQDFSNAYAAHTAGIASLSRASEQGPYSGDDLAMLLRTSFKEDAIGAFRFLVRRNAAQITPEMLETSFFTSNPRFFDFVDALFTSPFPVRADTLAAASRTLISEIDRRSSDGEQVEAFERLMLAVVSRNPQDPDALTNLVVEFASPTFTQNWLSEYSHDEKHVHVFARRLLSLYLAEEIDVGALTSLVDDLAPECSVVEEIVYVLLARRQLGDAINIAGIAPVSYRPQLYRILHPVVVAHGDPLALVTFGLTFEKQADRTEIRRLVQQFLKPNIDDRLDGLLDGFAPNDFFESIPSSLTREEGASLRNALMNHLGMPARTVMRHEPPQKVEGISGFLEELFSKISMPVKK